MNEETYINGVKISATAFMKMVEDDISGHPSEVRGFLLGEKIGDQIVIMDTLLLLRGFTTMEDAYRYMLRRNNQGENIVGWYHMLSDTDVSNKMLWQQFPDPFLGIVIATSPAKSVVDVGAFITYPEGCVPVEEPPSVYENEPMSGIEDLGINYKRYRALDISYFKSADDCVILDHLWENNAPKSLRAKKKKQLEHNVAENEQRVLEEGSFFSLINSFTVFQLAIFTIVIAGSFSCSSSIKFARYYWLPLALTFLGVCLYSYPIFVKGQRYIKSVDELEQAKLSLRNFSREDHMKIDETILKNKQRGRSLVWMAWTVSLIVAVVVATSSFIISCHKLD